MWIRHVWLGSAGICTEEKFGICFTERTTSKEGYCLREMKKNIVDVDRRMLEECAGKAPMIAKVVEHPGWARTTLSILDGRPFWDYRYLA